jgi:hypothetical protein
VIIVDLDGFIGRMTHVVLNMIEHISERIKEGIAIWELAPPSEMGIREAIANFNYTLCSAGRPMQNWSKGSTKVDDQSRERKN